MPVINHQTIPEVLMRPGIRGQFLMPWLSPLPEGEGDHSGYTTGELPPSMLMAIPVR